ncbi:MULTISPECIES: hypothetical protein [unclassified Acinetobacter]|uniref:OB-fold protein n=1 Tax=unclassified Acinetobacter TaxID=196816 RepID=UPI0015D45755|nr:MULTISPECIES: hypothetical protein [unclassified Acinetobacter]
MNDTTIQPPFSNPQPAPRKVSILLGIGIFLFPLIFAWFTLRAGHTTLSRVVSFVWLALSLIIVFATPSNDTNYAENSANQSEPAALISNEEQQVQAPAAIQVSASELFQNYEANEVAADRNFKGQIIEITGSVKAIDSGMGDGANVQFNVGDEYGLNSVTASGDESFDNFAASLSKGQTVTLRCVGGGEVIGQPFLRDCQAI